jgi:hypothetical protein
VGGGSHIGQPAVDGGWRRWIGDGGQWLIGYKIVPAWTSSEEEASVDGDWYGWIEEAGNVPYEYVQGQLGHEVGRGIDMGPSLRDGRAEQASICGWPRAWGACLAVRLNLRGERATRIDTSYIRVPRALDPVKVKGTKKCSSDAGELHRTSGNYHSIRTFPESMRQFNTCTEGTTVSLSSRRGGLAPHIETVTGV